MRHIFLIAGIFIVFGLFYLLTFAEVTILYNIVIPERGNSPDSWLESFRSTTILGVSLAFGAALFWYAAGAWIFNFNKWGQSHKRPIWVLLLALTILFAVYCSYITPNAREGVWLAYVLHVINIIPVYYLATLLFSPSSVKYIPPGATLVRRW